MRLNNKRKNSSVVDLNHMMFWWAPITVRVWDIRDWFWLINRTVLSFASGRTEKRMGADLVGLRFHFLPSPNVGLLGNVYRSSSWLMLVPNNNEKHNKTIHPFTSLFLASFLRVYFRLSMSSSSSSLFMSLGKRSWIDRRHRRLIDSSIRNIQHWKP